MEIWYSKRIVHMTPEATARYKCTIGTGATCAEACEDLRKILKEEKKYAAAKKCVFVESSETRKIDSAVADDMKVRELLIEWTRTRGVFVSPDGLMQIGVDGWNSDFLVIQKIESRKKVTSTSFRELLVNFIERLKLEGEENAKMQAVIEEVLNAAK